VTTNYYEILGVKASDSAAEIESRYRALALELHPGWSSGDASEAEKSQRLAEATQAFDTLSDADKRAQYDAWLDLSKDSGELPDFEESVRNPNASECMFCAHSPAIQVTFRREVGMLVRRQRYRISGRYCRNCGMALFRDTQNATLISGWWGIISAPVNVGSVIGNYRSYLQLRRLDGPRPPSDKVRAKRTQPAPIGRPLVKRPGVWLAPVVVAVLIVAGVNYAKNETHSSGFNYQVGSCVTTSGHQIISVVDCAQPHFAQVISIGTSAAYCPAGTTQTVKEQSADAQPGEIVCLDDTE
jgi:curved DNA-binding protein CbpA